MNRCIQLLGFTTTQVWPHRFCNF